MHTDRQNAALVLGEGVMMGKKYGISIAIDFSDRPGGSKGASIE